MLFLIYNVHILMIENSSCFREEQSCHESEKTLLFNLEVFRTRYSYNWSIFHQFESIFWIWIV